jgi:hypothetical protein
VLLTVFAFGGSDAAAAATDAAAAGEAATAAEILATAAETLTAAIVAPHAIIVVRHVSIASACWSRSWPMTRQAADRFSNSSAPEAIAVPPDGRVAKSRRA